MSIRVFIVEDHETFRRTIVEFLTYSGDLEVCGEAGSAEEAEEAVPLADPDILVLDVSLPGRSGLELLEGKRDEWRFPCLIVSGHGVRRYVERAFAAGARGYVLKGQPHQVLAGIRRLVSGRPYLSPSLGSLDDYEIDGVGT